MILRFHTAAVLVLTLAGGIASGDVIVRVQVLEGQDLSPATTQPGKTILSIEALTDAAGRFHARTSVGNQIIELTGNVKQLEKDNNQVQVSFLDQSEDHMQHNDVHTNIEVHLNQPKMIGGLQSATDSAGWSRIIVLTLANEATK